MEVGGDGWFILMTNCQMHSIEKRDTTQEETQTDQAQLKQMVRLRYQCYLYTNFFFETRESEGYDLTVLALKQICNPKIRFSLLFYALCQKVNAAN